MSSVPASIRDLNAYWVSKGGVGLGIVGNTKHCVGYHLGADRIFGDCACRPDGSCQKGLGNNDYSVRIARDRAGLTNAAAAIDLGRLNGKLKGLQDFSKWLVRQCQAKAPGTDQVREVIYSPDGDKVQRYSGVDGKIHTGPGNGDLSHRTHTHISFFRDTEKDRKVGIFAPYFEDTTPPDSGTGDDTVQSFRVPEERTVVKLPKGANLYDNSDLKANANTKTLDPGREFVLIGWPDDPGVSIVAYEPPTGDPGENSRAMFAKTSVIADSRVDRCFTRAERDAAYNNGLAAAEAAVHAVPRR